ncbi:hypothetical protein [Weissella paramesenteroides]|uniref:hypothetical protein n=1 Tax=Weissella paramesenteroides TaxID=1249 RepID=UPI0038578B51
MKFLNEQGQEVTLKRAENLPGFEVMLSENTVIESAVNNPFFKGINILQLPKKLKGFRDNSDLNNLLDPKKVRTGIKLELDDNELAIFSPNIKITDKKLKNTNFVFGNGEMIEPSFINFSLKNVVLEKGTNIGFLIICNAIL